MRILAGAVVGLGLALSWAKPAAAQIESITDVDKSIIVDCFLKGQVRKLGNMAGTRIVAGTRVQTPISLAECGARGGDAVLYDAADPRQAQRLWQESAAQGDPFAQNRLGQIHEIGIGGAPDYVEAAKWYKRAADSGNRAAAVNLAALYERGQGVPKDMNAAVALYRKARGLTEAPGAADEVAATRAQLLEAQKRINALEKDLEDLRQSGRPTTSKEADLSAAKKQEAALLGGAKPLPSGVALEVGDQAGLRPTIAMLDPNVVLTRGSGEINLRGDVKVKEIAGRAKARAGLAEIRVNGKPVSSDRWGFFAARVPVESSGTSVSVVAIDRIGEREELSFVLKPGSQIQGPAPVRDVRAAASGFGEFHALVIGNNRYRFWQPLNNAEGDAKAVADVLEKKYGFKHTKLLLNATFAQILNAINDYAKSLGPNDNLLIYYAGHGQLDLGGKRGYWIPVDGELERNTNWILNVQITDLLQKMQAHRVLVVSDSCYSGAMTAAENGAIPTIRAGLPDNQWLMATKTVLDVSARTMLTSGALSPVDDGGGDGHSLFARAFLDVLNANTGVLEGSQLFNALESRVLKMAQDRYHDQTPLYAGIQQAGHEGGDFFFVPAGIPR